MGTTDGKARDPRRRLRAISRIALYGSLVLVILMGGLLLHLSEEPLRPEQRVDWGEVDYAALEEVELLRQYVRVDTSDRTGDTLAGAEFLAGLLESEGIPYTLERVGQKDANLWAVLEGREPGAVVLHHHIDVEDIHRPDRWSHPPFEAEIDLPYLYGRGTYDMKSVGIAQFLAFRRLARSGRPLRKSVILLATSGEETGSELGVRWFLREHPELVDRFDLVLTEGGVIEARSLGHLKFWGTEFIQKRYRLLIACDDSRERLEALQRDVALYGTDDDQLLLIPEVEKFLETYAPTRDAERLRDALADPRAILRDRAVFEGLPGFLQAMFRNEIHPLGIRRVEGGWELPVMIHLLPGVELREVRRRLLPEWLFYGIDTVIYEEPSARHGSPLDHPALEVIASAVAESYPDVPVGPMFLPWTATDSRFFRAEGIPSYGFSPFTIMLSDVLRVSGPEERIGLPGYVEGVRIYDQVLRRLVT